jgi:hypothetical protein
MCAYARDAHLRTIIDRAAAIFLWRPRPTAPDIAMSIFFIAAVCSD